MKTNVIIEIEVSKQPLLTDKDTGKQKIRLTLEEARELHGELSKLLTPQMIQPTTQWPGILPGPNRPNPYTPGPKITHKKIGYGNTDNTTTSPLGGSDPALT